MESSRSQDPEFAERLRRLRAHGMDMSDLARAQRRRDVVVESYPERGWNYRMTDMQAALGLCQLEVLDEMLESRRRLAERYSAALDRIPDLEAPVRAAEYAIRTWQSYCVRVVPGAAGRAHRADAAAARDGIPTRRGVMAIHQEAAYADAQRRPAAHRGGRATRS